MNDMHINIKHASNGAFFLAVLLIGGSWFITHEVLSFVATRVGVFLAFASVFWGLYGQSEKGRTMKQIWDEKSESQSNSFTDELWLYQPFIFSMSGVVLALYKNPWV